MNVKTEIREKPILFSTEMVKAILEGRKTETRRVIKPQPELLAGKGLLAVYEYKGYVATPLNIDDEFINKRNLAPYQVGQRLWVRETFCMGCYDAPSWSNGGTGDCDPMYFGKDAIPKEKFDSIIVDYKADLSPQDQLEKGIFYPSIFMPRWASRINLEVTGIRAERLQEISEDEAKAEGAEWCGANDERGDERCYYDGFVDLWNRINGKKYPWLSNPWVWVIQFRVLSKGAIMIINDIVLSQNKRG